MNRIPNDTDHVFWMTKALESAQEAFERGEVPVGCVIVDQSKCLVAQTYNLRESLQDPTAHAEMMAMRRAASVLKNWRLLGCTLYVTLEPCLMCSGALILSRIPQVVYGAFDVKKGSADFLNSGHFNHTCHVLGGVLEGPCQELLKSFFKQRRGDLKRQGSGACF